VPSVSGGSFLWSNGATTPSITVSPGSNTNYSVTYSFAGCTTGPVTATVSVGTTPTVNLTVGTPTVCSGNAASLSASGSGTGSYLWMPGGEITSSISPIPTATTTYTVQYTSDGCSATQTGVVTLSPSPTVTVSDTSVCAGESATLYASGSSGGGSFVWSPGLETGSSITVTPASTSSYSVVYTLGSCSSAPAAATVTINPLPATTVTQSGNLLSADQNFASYQWLDCNNAYAMIPGINTQSYLPPANGSYAVQIDLGGCADTSACVMILTTSVGEQPDNKFIVYPNPAQDLLNVTGEFERNTEYKLSDPEGRILMNGMITGNKVVIDLSKLANGIYFLEIGTSEKHRVIKN
jgi:hypothetical protein